jgi:hypothetical protein
VSLDPRLRSAIDHVIRENARRHRMSDDPHPGMPAAKHVFANADANHESGLHDGQEYDFSQAGCAACLAIVEERGRPHR